MGPGWFVWGQHRIPGSRDHQLVLLVRTCCSRHHHRVLSFTNQESILCCFAFFARCRVGAFPRGMTGSIQTVSEFGKILTEGQKDNCLPRLQFTYCDDNLLSKQVPRTGYPVNFPSYIIQV